MYLRFGSYQETDLTLIAIPGAMRWIADRYQNIPTQKGCQKHELTPESARAAKQRFFMTGLAGDALAYLNLGAVGPSPLNAWLTQFPAL
jgi:hypothetical protein